MPASREGTSRATVPDASVTVTPSASDSNVRVATNECDPEFAKLVVGVAVDDIPGAPSMAMCPQAADQQSVSCYAPGPHRDFHSSRWCCKTDALITAHGECDARFPRHIQNVHSLSELPPDHGMSTNADSAIASKSSCYAPRPHTAFNTAHWCCK